MSVYIYIYSIFFLNSDYMQKIFRRVNLDTFFIGWVVPPPSNSGK